MINPVKGLRQQEGGKGYYQEITICTTRPEEEGRVTINLDGPPVEIVKNGKRYSLIEFIENCINDVLDLRMHEEGTDNGT